MGDLAVMGLLLGAGTALAVGPIFLLIMQEAATQGLRSSLWGVLGADLADLVLLVPAIVCSWLLASVATGIWWVALGRALL
jgi:threonine/homoserine/homoserine lactone efflux protein